MSLSLHIDLRGINDHVGVARNVACKLAHELDSDTIARCLHERRSSKPWKPSANNKVGAY